MEHLGVGRVGLAGEKVERRVGFFVVAYFDLVDVRDGCHPAPLGAAAGPGGVEVADVDCAEIEEVLASGGGVLALPGARRDSCPRTYLAERASVGSPLARLLEPADVELADPVGDLERGAKRVTLVCVDGDDEARPGRLPNGPDTLRILLPGSAGRS